MCQSRWSALTKYHSLGAYKQQTFISRSSGGWMFNIEVLARSRSGEGPLLGPYLEASPLALTCRRAEEALWVCFIRH